MAEVSLRDEYNQEATRLTTFLQSVPVAAIAFTMHETADRAASLSLIPIVLAVAAWGLSFVFGIVNSHGKQETIHLNIYQLEFVQAGRESELNKLAPAIADAKRKSRTAHAIQYYSILIGATFYFVGQGWHMIDLAVLRSPAPAAQKSSSPVAPPAVDRPAQPLPLPTAK